MGRDLLAEGGVFAAKPVAQLERLEALAVQFGGAAHDVCNLLGAIRLTTQDALRRPEAAALKELLEEILACADQATDVVRNNGVDSLADEGEVDLIDLVTSKRLVLRRIAGRRVDLALRFSSVSPIYGSPTSIAQAVTNLVKNAAEAMKNQEGRITVSTRMDGDHVVLEVEDDGPGFDATCARAPVKRSSPPNKRGVDWASRWSARSRWCTARSSRSTASRGAVPWCGCASYLRPDSGPWAADVVSSARR